MLTPADIIAAKFLRQLTRIPTETLITVLRETDAASDSSFDFVARLAEHGQLTKRQVRRIRQYVARFEHIRHEAFYLRNLAKAKQVSADQVAELLARIEMDQYRRRLGHVLIDLGLLSDEQAKALEKQTRAKIFREDLKVLHRYRKTDFEGVQRPMFPDKKIDENLFRVPVLFPFRASVDDVEREIVKLKLEESLGDLDVSTTGAFEFAPPNAKVLKEEAQPEPSKEPVAAGSAAPTLDSPAHNASDSYPALPEEELKAVRRQIATARFQSLAARQPRQSLKDRRILGPYKIVECLGEGGMGAVFMAEDPNSNLAAVKVTRAQDPNSDDYQRFKREAQIMEQLDHPNLPKLFEINKTHDGLIWMSLTLYTGQSLKALLEQKKYLAPEEAFEIFEQVLDALNYVHQLGYVHRDVKPENVFIQPGPKKKIALIDFGIARSMADPQTSGIFQTRAGIVSGSPAYVAPETVSSDDIDQRTDLYSAGILLFEMLTGALPLRAQTPYDFLREHLVGAPLTLSQARREHNWAPELETLIASLLGKEREQRPYSCALVLKDFRENVKEQALYAYHNGAPKDPKDVGNSSLFNSFFNLLRG